MVPGPPLLIQEGNRIFIQRKLDQEIRLCRTHLEDLSDNIWTILHHIRSYFTLLDHFGSFWIFLDHLRSTLTILDTFKQFFACQMVLGNCQMVPGRSRIVPGRCPIVP